jgi:L-lactate dehydrogenase complex protein LldE
MAEPVTLFVPCYVDQLRPQAGVAAVELLERLGHRVEVRPDVVCCGQPFTNSGAAGQGAALARRWYEEMAPARAVVVLSSSCTVQLRHARRDAEAATGAAGRGAAWRGGPAGAAPAPGSDPAGAPEVFELCEFLDARHPGGALGRLERSVCLHSSCHGLRDSDADRHARALLGRVAGLHVLRPRRPDECCGFGGTFSVSFAALSVRMGEDRLNDILSTGAREVIATDLSCLLHLEGIAAARGERLAFRHIGEILREALGEGAAPR